MCMKREELFFSLPKSFIAQQPVEPRDHCRLMIADPVTQAIEHKQFFHLLDYLRPGDVLVFNQSKVLPARLLARKRTGGEVEIVLLRDLGAGKWQCLIGGRVKPGMVLAVGDMQASVIESRENVWIITFNKSGDELVTAINRLGRLPTPPYIKQAVSDPAMYQTVYAKTVGSAAAPTAGLHFTQELLDKLVAKGVQTEFVTLHVGLGTFQPVKTDNVEKHAMHYEWFSVEAETWKRITQAKKEGCRIIAVGTTSVRVLETLAQKAPPATDPIIGETNIFILPGYTFGLVDALITNFHTPYSTLLALVYAFGGTDFIRQAYTTAVAECYRFFSFGDAMFIPMRAPQQQLHLQK